MLSFVGSMSLAAALPGAASASVAGAAGIGGALPDIEARLTALADFAPVPMDFAADLTLAGAVVAGVTLAIGTPGLVPPSISAQVEIIADLVASLHATIEAVNVQLGIVHGFVDLLATAGVFAYAYAGRADAMGTEMATELSGGFPGGSGGDATNAIVLATTSSATWAAMSQVFRVAP